MVAVVTPASDTQGHGGFDHPMMISSQDPDDASSEFAEAVRQVAEILLRPTTDEALRRAVRDTKLWGQNSSQRPKYNPQTAIAQLLDSTTDAASMAVALPSASTTGWDTDENTLQKVIAESIETSKKDTPVIDLSKDTEDANVQKYVQTRLDLLFNIIFLFQSSRSELDGNEPILSLFRRPKESPRPSAQWHVAGRVEELWSDLLGQRRYTSLSPI